MIFSDHKNLTLFTTTKQLTRRQVRWAELLGQFKFEIRYTPGNENKRADALSRRSDYMEGKDIVEYSILKTNEDGSLSANSKEFGNSNKKVLVQPGQPEQECISMHHDDPLQGHSGITKTMKKIQRNYTFPHMRSKITTYIKKCQQCQTNKAERHAKYGHIQFIEPPERLWDEVTMDFITKLPLSKDPVTKKQYDSILVMVDRLTKYSHFVPCSESYTAQDLGYLVLDRLVRYHGIPKTFITDRDKLFTSNFWKTLVACMGTKHKLLTAYHPTTDGQTERMNQTLEVYLRHYVNVAQDNWVSLLLTAQMALNNEESATTKVSPFFANFGKHPNMFMRAREGPHAQEAMVIIKNLKDIHNKCIDNINTA